MSRKYSQNQKIALDNFNFACYSNRVIKLGGDAMTVTERDILDTLTTILKHASLEDKLYILGIAKGMAAKAELADQKAS